MYVIIQAGHDTSYSHAVMERLYKRGIALPNDSYTHRLSAQDVADNIHKIIDKRNASNLNARVLDNITADFLLANLDQELWGWQSAKNLVALNYWRAVFPEESRFVLIFDHPKNFFMNLDIKNTSSDALKKKIQEWVEYHHRLLAFFENHSHISVLLEGKTALQNLSELNDGIKKIAHDITLKNHWQANDYQKFDNIAKTNILQDLVIEQLLAQFPEMMNIYLALLEKTTSQDKYLPLQTQLTDVTELLTVLQESKDYDLLKIELIHVQNQELTQKINQQQQEIDQLNRTKAESDKLIIEQKKQLDSHKAQLEQKAKQPVATNNTQLQQENDLLIAQLHQVQEELEKYYLENQRLKTEQAKPKQPPKPVYYGAAERVKQDLPYRLGSTMVSHSKSTKGLATLPLALLKEYQEFQKHQGNQKDLPSIEEYQDVKEAEKVKKHLSYKLGKTLVDGVKSPKSILDLPVKMGKEIVGFRNK